MGLLRSIQRKEISDELFNSNIENNKFRFHLLELAATQARTTRLNRRGAFMMKILKISCATIKTVGV
jgi:hypothetical protein